MRVLLLMRGANDNIPHQSKCYPYTWAGTKYCPNCGRRMLPSNEKE